MQQQVSQQQQQELRRLNLLYFSTPPWEKVSVY
jgi:hypothetical protein